jgi:Fe-S cluster biogenesis protein NfuA
MIMVLEKLFDEQVRPALAAHGGNVEIVDVDNGKLFVRPSWRMSGMFQLKSHS